MGKIFDYIIPLLQFHLMRHTIVQCALDFREKKAAKYIACITYEKGPMQMVGTELQAPQDLRPKRVGSVVMR